MTRFILWTLACALGGLICYATPGGWDAGSGVAYWLGGLAFWFFFVQKESTGGNK